MLVLGLGLGDLGRERSALGFDGCWCEEGEPEIGLTIYFNFPASDPAISSHRIQIMSDHLWTSGSMSGQSCGS